MSLMKKSEHRFQTDLPTIRNFYTTNSLYSIPFISKEQILNNRIVGVSDKTYYFRGSSFKLCNVTHNKYGDGGEMCSYYNHLLFYPINFQLFSFDSVTGAILPRNSNYPTLIDFNSLGYTSIFNRILKEKNNLSFQKKFSNYIVQWSSLLNIRAFTKEEKYYLNINDFKFYDIKTNKPVKLNLPDKEIFTPFYDFNIKTNDRHKYVLRKWNDFKYFGSIGQEIDFEFNQDKIDEYAKSLLNNNEKFIKTTIDFNEFDKLDKTKFLLGYSIPQYYDWNNELTFSINSKNYTFDIYDGNFYDEFNNIIEYITLNYSPFKILVNKGNYHKAFKDMITNYDISIKNKIKDYILSKNVNELYSLLRGNKINLDNKTLYKFKDILFFDLDMRTHSVGDYITEALYIKPHSKFFHSHTFNNEKNLNPKRWMNVSGYYKEYSSSLSERLKLGDITTDVKWRYYITDIEGKYFDYDKNYTEYTETYVDKVSDYKVMLDKWRQNNGYYISNVIGNSNYSELKTYNYKYIAKKGLTTKDKDMTANNKLDLQYSLLGSISIYELTDKSYTIDLNNRNFLRVFSIYDIALLTFRIHCNITNTTYINNDTSFFYFYETEKETNGNIDTYNYFTLLMLNELYNNYQASVNKKINHFQRVEIPKNERLNYNYYKDIDGKFYTYQNISKPLDTPNIIKDYIIENDDGSIKFIDKEIYYDTNTDGVSKFERTNIEELIRFQLQDRTLQVDNSLKIVYEKYKQNNFSGLFIKYLDLNDNKEKIKFIEYNLYDLYNKIFDKKYYYINYFPTIPLYTALEFMTSGMYSDFNIFNLVFSKRYMIDECYLLASPYSKKIFNIYNKKANRYFKGCGIYNKEWDYQLNGEYIDKEYKVKNKRISKKFTNEKLKNYNESFIKNIKPKNFDDGKSFDLLSDINVDDCYNDISTYYNKEHGVFGVHLSVRFNFAIYFNKYMRATKLISLIGYRYLDYIFKIKSGKLNIPVNCFVYPPFRVNYIEKRKNLFFIKKQVTEKEKYRKKATIYTEFNYSEGKFIFFNFKQGYKITLDINKLYLNWKSTFFKERVEQERVAKSEDKYNFLTIKKEDIIPLKFIFNKVKPNYKYNVPIIDNKIKLSSYYYNTDVDLYIDKEGKQYKQSINAWKLANEFRCFYTPQYIANYNFNASINQLDNFEERNIFFYIKNILISKSLIELQNIYDSIINNGKIIKYITDTYNVFENQNLLSKKNDKNIFTENHQKGIKNFSTEEYEFNNIQPYKGIETTAIQGYYLYNNFIQNHLVIYNEELLDTEISNIDAIQEIFEYLYFNDLPNNKYITTQEFKKYFIDFDKETSNLFKIFTEAEIYELGFRNYLVTNIVEEYNSPTIVLEKIFEIIHKQEYLNYREQAPLNIESYYLPMYHEVFKKLPFYSKNFLSLFNITLEGYLSAPIPVVDLSYARQTKFNIYLTIIFRALIKIIFGIIMGNPTLIFSAIIEAVIELIAINTPISKRKQVYKAYQTILVVLAILSIFSSSGEGVGLVLAITNIITIVIKGVIEVVLSIQLKKDYKRLDSKIKEYDKSKEEVYKFIEENEFKAMYIETPYYHYEKTQKLQDIELMDLIEVTYDSLEQMYLNLDNYYDKENYEI